MPWIPSDLTHRLPSLTWQVRPQVQALVDATSPSDAVVDLGAGGRQLAPHVRCVDFVPFPGTDVVGDVQRLPLRNDSVDLVVGTGLLEHVEDDRALLAETFRVLRPGGLAHFELPFLQYYHDDPIDVRRYTVPGLARELTRAGLVPERSGFHIGPTVTLVWTFAYWTATLLEGRNPVAKALSNLAFAACTVLLWPLKFLDALLVNKRTAHRLAFGVYCTARKPATGPGGPRNGTRGPAA